MRSSFRAGPRVGLRRLTAGVVSGGVLAATLVGVGVGTASAVPAPLAYEQYAYGASASVGGVVTAGPLFPTGISCTIQPGLVATNGGLVNIPGVISAAPTFQSATTAESGPNNNQVAVTRSTVASVNLLGGLVGLTGLGVTATAVNTGSGVATAGAVSLGALTILGIPIPLGSIGPNTTIGIPLLGSITLNEQTVAVNGIRTIGAHIRILAGVNAGLDVIVGLTQSRFLNKPPVFMTGVAYSNLIAAGPVSVGPLVAQSVPCNGGTSTSNLVGINLPDIVTTGVITATGTAVLGNPTGGTSRLSVAGVNLLGGLITASAITSQANAIKSPGSPPALSSTGTQFANLTVAGIPLGANIAPNTAVVLPGVGYVVLNRQVQTASGLEVRAIEVVIQVGGVLPVGAVIRIGVASINASDTGASPLSAPLDGHISEQLSAPYATQLCSTVGDTAKCDNIDPSTF
ncbi:choice-of-anchor P family protein [Candidatus Frankia nodulisporulans]|uniref:choice-of-anchor P family protein n=1 Tax=Candidatus Frankia nodulisporulans TaxID=2060052 RepID=UPI0013D4EB48|nr:choice-of-anchor P family protein [Candidatus Frankia nodulisporulans]